MEFTVSLFNASSRNYSTTRAKTDIIQSTLKQSGSPDILLAQNWDENSSSVHVNESKHVNIIQKISELAPHGRLHYLNISVVQIGTRPMLICSWLEQSSPLLLQRIAKIRTLLDFLESYASKMNVRDILVGGTFDIEPSTCGDVIDEKWQLFLVNDQPRNFILCQTFEPLELIVANPVEYSPKTIGDRMFDNDYLLYAFFLPSSTRRKIPLCYTLCRKSPEKLFSEIVVPKSYVGSLQQQSVIYLPDKTRIINNNCYKFNDNIMHDLTLHP